MKAFFGKLGAFFVALWYVFQIITGAKKVMALRREDPPVPLVCFRQSSRFLVLWPVILLTWVMVFLMYLHGKETPPEWLPSQEWLGGWWATILVFAVLIWRVHMRGPITIAIVALILVFYFYMDKIGKWVPFLDLLSKIKITGNWGMYAILAGIATMDIFIVWLYARFHYFIATPNKGFLVWGWFASERPIEYTEYDLKIDVEDVVERAFGFGTFKLKHKTDPSLNIEFPCVFRIAWKMSKFNEITTEMRVKTIQAGTTALKEEPRPPQPD
ncbi:MAG: hypothetical protein ACYTG7_12745 [Planctomycetota bacterium]|jgi:hypothetical protein